MDKYLVFMSVFVLINFVCVCVWVLSISYKAALRWISQDLLDDDTDSGIVLVPSGKKPLPEPIFT